MISDGLLREVAVGTDAVALVHCTDAAVRDAIGGMGATLGGDYAENLRQTIASIERGEAPVSPLTFTVVGVGVDYVKLFTAIRYGDLEAEPERAQAVAHRIVELLPPGAHAEPKMILYPDILEPAGRTYAEVTKVLRGNCLLVSAAPLSVKAKRKRDRAVEDLIAQVNAAVGVARKR